MLGRKARRDQGPVTGPGIALDAQERRHRVRRHVIDDRREVYPIEDLSRVALPVLLGELETRALADADSRILPVLKLTELGGRSELLLVSVLDAGSGEGLLKTGRVGPRVLSPADAAPLANVEQLADVRPAQSVEKAVYPGAVHPNRGNNSHGANDDCTNTVPSSNQRPPRTSDSSAAEVGRCGPPRRPG